MTLDTVFDPVEVGRALGHDLYRWNRTPDPDRWLPSIEEGYASAAASRIRRRPADRFVRKWLQLRLHAFMRGLIVNDDVTPDLLRQIDVPRCPVTRTVLTHAERRDSDWSVDRLNNDGAYAANNLAVMSTGVNRAKGTRSYEAVYALAQAPQATDGLTPLEWLRLAALMLGPCFATRPALAPVIPLAAPICGRSVRPAAQQIQLVFTHTARRPAGKNALIKQFKPASRTERSQARLRQLAEVVHTGLKRVDEDHDVWLEPGVMAAFADWRGTLDSPAWALAGEISRRMAGGHVVPASRITSWHLGSRFRAT